MNFDAVPTEASADIMRSSGARMALYSWNPGQALYPHTDHWIQASLGRRREALGEVARCKPGPTLRILATFPEAGLKNPSTWDETWAMPLSVQHTKHGWLTLLPLVCVSVAQLCPTLCDPTDYAVHGILQARKTEWVDISFSR